jgi:hypothetical protein
MNDKIKKTSKKYIIIPAFAVGLIAILILTNVKAVSARHPSRSKGDVAQVLAEKFNLNPSEVEQTLYDFHQNNRYLKEQRKKDHLEVKLEQAVNEGNLTQAQSYDIMLKFEEMYNRLEELHEQDISKDEFYEMKADIHEEMQAWADDQGIDYDIFLRAGKKSFHGNSDYMVQ